MAESLTLLGRLRADEADAWTRLVRLQSAPTASPPAELEVKHSAPAEFVLARFAPAKSAVQPLAVRFAEAESVAPKSLSVELGEAVFVVSVRAQPGARRR